MKKKFFYVGIPLCVLLGLVSACQETNPVGIAQMHETQPVEIAPGIWKLTIGNPDQEIRYTEFADRTPRMDSLQKFAKKDFPFNPADIRFTQDNDHSIGLRIPASPDEDIFGFGLQFDGLKKRGRVLNLTVDHWGGGDGPTHAPVPFYISSKGYGVFINTARPYRIWSQVGNRKDAPFFPKPTDRNPAPGEKNEGWDSQPIGDAVEFQTNAHGLEIIVFAGDNLQDIVAKYNLYNGGGAMPPLWGLGFWHRVPAKYNAEETIKEVEQFKSNRIPLDVVGLEPGWMTKSYPCTFEWQTKRFADPKGFAQSLLKQGIRLNLWENPYISPEAKLYAPILPYTGTHTVWLGVVPDYTLPEARKLIAEQHRTEHIDIGVSGYKTDETDGYDIWLWPDHAQFPSGTNGKVMRQIYGLAMQKAYQQDLFRAKNMRSMGQVRSSSGGASGYSNVIYSDAYSHRQYITGISAGSLCGILWTPEIRSAGSEQEWLCRMQTAVFSPLAQLNAWATGTKPWSYQNVTPEVKALIDLRMQLLPYLYTAYADYNRKGIPPFRAMILEPGYKTRESVQKSTLDHTKNPYESNKTLEINDQYMIGAYIMAAPFYEGKSKKREVSLPAGDWYDFYTGKWVGNASSINVTNDGKMPLFVKDGGVIPMLTQSVMNTEAAYGHPLEIRYYGKKVGSGTLYEDDGKTFDYENGRFRIRTFEVNLRNESKFLSEKVTDDNVAPMFGKVENFRIMSE